jgi:hypothetical protein
MHKARKSFPPMPPLIPGSYDFDHPNLRLVGIPRGNVTVRGDYEELVKDLVDAMLDPNRDPEVIADLRQRYAHLLFIPIHELQIPNIETRFPDTVILSEKHSAKAEALASLRSVALPDILPSKSVKLCLGIKISSALRTVTPFTTYFGPGFSEVVPKLTYDRDILFVERELGTATYAHEDTDVAKHCSSVIRDAIEYNPEYKDDLFVPCGALVEKIQKPDTDETLVKNVWNLDTEEKKIDFLKK